MRSTQEAVEHDAYEMLKSVATEVLSSERHDASAPDSLIFEIKSRLKMKPFMPKFSDSEIRHALADAIQESHGRRDLVKGGRIVKVIDDDGKIFDVPIDLSLHVEETFEDIETWPEDASLGFGIRELDYACGGFFPGQVMNLVGSPGSMKTALALNMLYQFCKKYPNERALFFSLDMSMEKIVVRMLQNQTDKFMREVIEDIQRRDKLMRDAAREMSRRFHKRAAFVGQRLDGKDLSWNNMINVMTAVGADFVIIDYFQLISGPSSEMHAMKELLPKIVSLSNKHKMRFLLLSQMGRQGLADQKNKMGDHAAGGYYFTARADIEIELATQQDANGNTHIVAATPKTRSGRGKRYFDLEYSPRSLLFTGDCNEVRHKNTQNQKFDGLRDLS
jgi:KaiC/GvpD/RAD55 family RecA-like ATPase